MTEEYTIGIDLGTTYSCLAYMNEDGEPVVEKNFEQEETTPSVILFNENGEIIVGSPAKDMAMMYSSDRVVTAIKRQMGTDYEVEMDNQSYTPTMLSGMILTKIINDFNDNHGCKVSRAVITCPAYFGHIEREATINAGRIAGLSDVKIINEPTSAAISFGIDGSQDGMRRVLVYDLGGGTFDVTVLEINGSEFTAIATDGERLLGGKDWDAAITKIIRQKVCEESGMDEDEIMADEDVTQCLVLDSEVIKKRLSTAESTKGTLTAGGKKIVYTVTRSEFEAATAPLMETTLELIDRALDSKNIGMDDIDEVILVGGSSRMPQVKNSITAKYPNASVKIYDPDQSVAKGAALFARSCGWGDSVSTEGCTQPQTDDGIVIHNVLSKSFGIKAMYEDDREMISNIIFRNEMLPIESTKVYCPVDDGQTSIKVEIYENSSSNNGSGDRTELIDGCCVGEFEMELPEGVVKNTLVTVKFTATEEGILIASAECMGQHMDYQLQNRLQMTDADIERSKGLMDNVVNGN